MTRPTQLAYLCHMRDALNAVREYTAGGREAFLASPMMQDAVLRNVEVLREAVKGLDDSSRSRAPDVPWRRLPTRCNQAGSPLGKSNCRPWGRMLDVGHAER
jgi:uncharacterized protein with HEPN domain